MLRVQYEIVRPIKSLLRDLRVPAIVSSLLVIPLMMFEWVNRRSYAEGFPLPLFGLMWLLPAAFVLILMPVVREARAGKVLMSNPPGLLLRAALLILIAWLWAGIVLDQIPCFLGVPNCD
jgi:hypothetical protein